MKTLTQHIALAAAAFIASNSLTAQDTLQYRDGRIEAANVTEITPTLVKFKKAGIEDGPTYSEFKNDIEQVKFTNGSIEKFDYDMPETAVPVTRQEEFVPVRINPTLREFGTTKFLWNDQIISNREMHDVLLSLNDREITRYITTAKSQSKKQYLGFLTLPCFAAAAAFTGVALDTYGSPSELFSAAGVCAGVGVLCFSTAITMKVKRTKNEKAAVRLYQEKY